jgi:hypothetical protein
MRDIRLMTTVANLLGWWRCGGLLAALHGGAGRGQQRTKAAVRQPRAGGDRSHSSRFADHRVDHAVSAVAQK